MNECDEPVTCQACEDGWECIGNTCECAETLEETCAAYECAGMVPNACNQMVDCSTIAACDAGYACAGAPASAPKAIQRLAPSPMPNAVASKTAAATRLSVMSAPPAEPVTRTSTSACVTRHRNKRALGLGLCAVMSRTRAGTPSRVPTRASLRVSVRVSNVFAVNRTWLRAQGWSAALSRIRAVTT